MTPENNPKRVCSWICEMEGIRTCQFKAVSRPSYYRDVYGTLKLNNINVQIVETKDFSCDIITRWIA